MIQDFVNSATEAQKKLHADMRRDEDPRWHLLPVDPAPKPKSRFIWLAFVLPGAALALIGVLREVM